MAKVITVFAPVELYFINRAARTLSRFAITDNLPGLLEILQIVADTRDAALDDVAILDPLRPGKIGSAARIGAHYGIRKRTFSEKLDNVQTWTIPEGGGDA